MKVLVYGYTVEMADCQIRKNFTLKELANNKGNPALPQFIIDRDVDTFLDMIQEFRNWLNKPMTVNSMYRQENYNRSIGGDSRSAHIHACGLDWGIKGHTEQQRKNVVNKWASICKSHGIVGAIGIYTNGYHLEAFSNKWYGNKDFQKREWRGTKSDW